MKRFVWLLTAPPLRESAWLIDFPALQGPSKVDKCLAAEMSYHCVGAETSSASAKHVGQRDSNKSPTGTV